MFLDVLKENFPLPLHGPPQEERGKVSGQQRSHFLWAAEYQRSWQVCTYWNVLLSHTCDEHTHQAWSLSSHWSISALNDKWKNYLAPVLRSQGAGMVSSEYEPMAVEKSLSGQAGLQWNKTHQWGVSQKFVSSQTVKAAGTRFDWLTSPLLCEHLRGWLTLQRKTERDFFHDRFTSSVADGSENNSFYLLLTSGHFTVRDGTERKQMTAILGSGVENSLKTFNTCGSHFWSSSQHDRD